jgi:hypothetical protein
VTTITVTGSGASNFSPKIMDSRTISQIVRFVDSHRTGWDVPWSGVPVPVVVAEFYSGTEFKGSLGVGKDFLETQRDGGFFSQSAAPDEVRGFLELLTPNTDSLAVRAESEHILDGDFRIVRSGDPLPTQVKSAFAALVRDSRFGMADPGQDFQLTDVIHREGVPRRRLIFAGISDKKCFLHYEMGGRGHSYYVVVFVSGPSEATFIWGGTLPKPAATLVELQSNHYVATILSDGNMAF